MIGTRILSQSFLFQGLSDPYLKQVAGIALGRDYPKGETIFVEGDEGSGFYLVANGLVKVFKASPDGKEQILHILGPGEPFGEVAVFAGRRFPASAEALADSHLLFFPRKAFVSLVSAHPALALNMLAVLSLRLRQFTVQVENLSLKEVPARLAGYLLVLSREQGGKDHVTLSISKGQLASLLGTIPETLSRIFLKMKGQGLIEVSGPIIRLLDRKALERLDVHGKEMV